MTEPTTWRDLAGELTEAQLDELDAMESVNTRAPDLLDMAREFAADNMSALLFPDVQPPTAAVETWGWREGPNGWSREWTGRTWTVGPAQVILGGYQAPDGTSRTAVTIISSDAQTLTANQARQLAEAVTQAAYEAEAAGA